MLVSFFLMIRVDGTFLLNALFREELVPILSFAECACSRYGFPVETPTSDLSFKRWAWVALVGFYAAPGVYYPATVFFFQQSCLLEERRLIEVFKNSCQKG